MSVVVAQQPHSRRLVIGYESSRATVLLDQGFGFPAPARRVAFDFQAAIEHQAQTIEKLDVTCISAAPSFAVVVPG